MIFFKILFTKLFENSDFCLKVQFWQNPNIFTSFSRKFFLTIFLVKSKLSTAKEFKTTTFSRVFHPKKSTIFSGNQSWIFGKKNEDFEQVKIQCFKFSKKSYLFRWWFCHRGLGYQIDRWRLWNPQPNSTQAFQLDWKHLLSGHRLLGRCLNFNQIDRCSY